MIDTQEFFESNQNLQERQSQYRWQWLRRLPFAPQ
jgi:hypothetical protein